MKKLLATLLALGALTACGGKETSCTTREDCFRGESCVDMVCVAASDTIVINADPNNTANNTTPNNTAANNNTTPNDITPNNTTSTNATPNNTSSGLCKVDPFTAMCPADENDDFGEYLRTETGRGCLGGGDDFEGGTYTLVDQTMCPLEAADKFSTNLIPCDNVTFVVEVTVTPQQACDPNDWDLNVRLQGNDCAVTNDKVRCETLPDGSKRVTSFLEPDISIASPYIDITPIAENLQFDYDLEIVVRL